ncbi:hypothetical protein MXB_4612 [Myxobolus squamalis]|nr:hypothetical protein MXB_4612 [Myxobolus squamalis]
MPVHAQVGTLISLSFQSSVGVKFTKSAPYLLPLGNTKSQDHLLMRKNN